MQRSFALGNLSTIYSQRLHVAHESPRLPAHHALVSAELQSKTSHILGEMRAFESRCIFESGIFLWGNRSPVVLMASVRRPQAAKASCQETHFTEHWPCSFPSGSGCA